MHEFILLCYKHGISVVCDEIMMRTFEIIEEENLIQAHKEPRKGHKVD